MSKWSRKEEGCCGSCRHHRYDPDEKTWVCLNRESDNYAMETEYNDSCVDYEKRWQKG